MNSEKIFVIGDIHGCLDMLNRLMDKIAWRPDKDRLIFLGDYIDRGENPKGVVDYTWPSSGVLLKLSVSWATMNQCSWTI